MNERLAANLPYILLCLLIGFYAVAGVIWINSNDQIQGVDEVDYLQSAQRFERYWPEDWSSPLGALGQITDFPFYAPTAPMTLIIAKLSGDIFGRSLEALRLLTLAGYLLVAVLVFILGRRFAGPWAGLIAAAMFVSFPFGYIHSRHFNAFALNALGVTGTITAMYFTKNLTRWFGAILFGIVFGCALLMERGTPPLVLFWPVAAYCIGVLVHHLRATRHRIPYSAALIALAGIIAWIIAGRYLLGYLEATAGHNRDMISNPYWESRAVFDFFLIKGVKWMTDRPYAYLVYIISIIILIKDPIGRRILAIAIGFYLLFNIESLGLKEGERWVRFAIIGAAVIHLKNIKERFVLVAWLIPPVLVFSFFASKDLQFIYTVMPAFAIAGGVLLVNAFENTKLKKALACLFSVFVLISMFQFTAVSFPTEGRYGLYQKLPSFFRFADGKEAYGPMKTHRPAEVEDIAAQFGNPKSGVVLYIPGRWENTPICAVPPQYEAGAYHWMIELQIYMDYTYPGLDHIVFPETAHEKIEGLAAGENAVIFYQVSGMELERFQDFKDRDDYNYIVSFMSDYLVDIVLERLPQLPGAQVGKRSLFCGKELKFYLLSSSVK